MTDRTPIIAGNWKMHRDHLEAIQLVQKLAYHLDPDDYADQDVVVCPPFTALRAVQNVILGDKLPIALGAQNVHHEDEGAYTGEVSAPMLKRLDVAYVIVGHSERRALFDESDETVNAKLAAVRRHGMRPILCVGETLEEREAGRAVEVVGEQLRGSLAGVKLSDASELVVAYEPVWAIGTGKTASSADAQELCAAVREVLAELFGDELASGIRVQYGGSVKPGNIRELMAQPDIDGALVGGASLQSEDFALIVGHRRG
ncbi:triose-phosphate isomerase [Nitriliruptoraceae bacterium ZYF776]|nr:triose-phosphate isomerase [Profundirhabdus halotolerans]